MNHIGLPPSVLYIWTALVFHLLYIYINHIGLPPSVLYIWTTSVFHLLVYIYEPHRSSTFWFIYMNHIGLPPSVLYIWTTLVFHLLVYIYEPHPSSTFWFIWIKVSKFIQMTVYTHAPGLHPSTLQRFCFIVNVTQYEIWFKLQTKYWEYIILFMLKHINVWITSHQLVDM